MGPLLMILGLILIGAGFPAEGLPGVTLAMSGMAVLWTGYFLFRKGGTR